MGKQLTDKEKKFVAEYCGPAKYNKSKAGRAIGVTARHAWRIYQRPHVRRAIDKRLDRLAMRSGEILSRLSDMAEGSLEPFIAFDEDGDPRIDLSTRRAKQQYGLIRKPKTKRRIIPQRDGNAIEEKSVDIEIHDPKDALVQLGRIRGLYTERNDDGSVAGPNSKVYVGFNPDDVL